MQIHSIHRLLYRDFCFPFIILYSLYKASGVNFEIPTNERKERKTMKFTADKEAFLKALQPVAYSASNVTNPQYKTLMIKLEGDTLEIYSYDLEKALKTTIEVSGEEDGLIEADAQKICAVISAMSDGDITVSTNSKCVISIEGSNTDFNIMGRDGSMYPALPILAGEYSFKIPKSRFKGIITKTLFAVSKDESRPVYMGSLFTITGETLTVTALDGNRVASRVEDVIKKGDESSAELDVKFIIPGKGQDDILKILDDSEDEIEISMTRKHIIMSFDNIYYSCRLIDGDFMNYRRLVFDENVFEIDVDTAEFIDSVSRCGIILEKNNAMEIELSGCEFKVSCRSDTGAVNDTISSNFEKGFDNNLKIGFNHRLVLDALRNCGEERIHVSFNGAVNPMIIKPIHKDNARDDRFIYIVMPVQLR